MRILLLNVPHPSIGSRIPDDHLPPLGLLSIGGPLIDDGHEVRLLDADLDAGRCTTYSAEALAAEVVLKEGGHLVSATQPVSAEEAARHRVSGAMMRLAPSGEGLGRIARMLEEGTIRADVAAVYALQDAAEAWNDIAGKLPGVHGMSPGGPGTARRRSHGKIVLRGA